MLLHGSIASYALVVDEKNLKTAELVKEEA